MPFDAQRIFDSDSISQLSFLPRSVVITGASIIAIEYANIFTKLGAAVTMLVRRGPRDSIARLGLDEDIMEALLGNLQSTGVTMLEHTEAVGFKLPADPFDLTQKVVIALKGADGEPSCRIAAIRLVIASNSYKY